MRKACLLATFLAVSLAPALGVAADPVASPSRKAEEGQEAEQEKKQKKKEGAVDVPAVRVKGQKEQPKANDPVGTYDQPRWTVRRPFSMSRVYVNPSGYAEFNIFFTPEFALAEPSDASIATEYEFEVGLGSRLQFDAYLVTAQQGWGGPFGVVEEKLELRYAFADWGEIWGNPTLYLEWAHGHPNLNASSLSDAARADTEHPPGANPSTDVRFDEIGRNATTIEPKFLLGGNLSDKLFGAANVVYETTLGGESVHEFGLSGGLAYLVKDPELFIGGDLESEVGFEGGSFYEFGAVLGPSVQWYPSEPVHVGFSALFGLELEAEGGETEAEGLARTRLIVGYEF